MPSYIEGNKFLTGQIGKRKVNLKPIILTDYKAYTKYDITLNYEDDTVKHIELVPEDSNRPYKFIFKKDAKLYEVIGIPRVVEINEATKYCDFPNRIMDSKDLLFDVDISDKFHSDTVRFYLKDVRDMIDLVNEGLYPPDDDMDEVLILNGGSSYDKF